MTDPEENHASDDQNKTLRMINHKTVADYLSRQGQARLSRHELFAEDGQAGLWTSDTLTPVVTIGRDRLAEHARWSLKCFPDWEWYDINIFDTQDPEQFWAECDGRGLIRYPDYPEGYYENHFIHSFKFRGTEILTQREFMNPFQQLRALQIPAPTIKRGGIPLGE
ncbi:PhzA/PhzB family protein [Kocuria varians]|uniref:PhzA/PhzB family protein n=1 Tax=Kocuria varians TaxID=1272 RepID=UPI000838D2D2|nr:PhzA/PhzB family protein [Kocuria varians]